MYRRFVRRLGMFAGLCCVVGCQDSAPTTQISRIAGDLSHSWEDVFLGGELELETPERALLAIGQVVVGTNGDFYLPSGSGDAPTILRYRPNGRLFGQIPVQGVDAFAAFALSPDDSTLFVFQPQDRRVFVLSNPEGEVLRTLQLSRWPSALVPLRDGTLVTYTVIGDPKGKVFERFSADGRRLAASHRVDNDALRIFHARVQTGGIVPTRGGLVGLHPNAFELVRLSPDLEVIEVMRAYESEGGTPWAEQPPRLPADLDPYEYQPAHEAWWDSFLHIGQLFSLTDNLILVTVWTSQGMSDVDTFANIYSVSGEIVAEGIRVPHDARIVGAGGGRAFLVRNATMTDADSMAPLKFYAYTLRDTVTDRLRSVEPIGP